MRIFILDKEKITKFNLPEQISGIYAIDYLPAESKIKRTISIEAQEGNWVIKSNGSINVISGDMIQSAVLLKEYEYQPIQVKDHPEAIIGIYCLPSVEKNTNKYMVQNGNITIGSANDCGICYSNNYVLPHHITIEQAQNGNYFIATFESDNRYAYLNDKRLTKTQLKIGDVIFLYGLKIIWMGNFIQINQPKENIFINNFNLVNYIETTEYDNTQIEPISDEEKAIELYTEHDYFFHTPRLTQSIDEENVTIDPPPQQQEQEDMPFLLTIGSMITMLSTSLMNGYTTIYGISTGTRTLKDSIPNIIMICSMLIGGAIMPRITAAYQKNKRKQKEKKRQKKYKAYIKEKEEEINLKLINQAQILRTNNIGINECYNLALSKNKNVIWNREIRDEDFLNVKVGNGSCPAKINISAPEKKFTIEEDNLTELAIEIASKSHTLENVPVTFSFTKHNISAFVCNNIYNQDFLNGILLQLMTYQSSQDLKIIYMFTKNKTHLDFNYIKFAPHCISDDKLTRFYAENIEDIKKISNHLDIIFKKRQKEFYGKDKKDNDEEIGKELDKKNEYKNFDCYYMIISNDYTAIKDIPIIKQIINSKPNLGFSLTIIDDSLQSLPNECSAFINLLEKEGCILEKELNNQLRFTPEIVTEMNMRAVSNRLANIPISYTDELSALPTSISFLEMYNVARIEQLNIKNRWRTNNPISSLSVPIGVHTSGDLFNLDLHEKYHGPHGLVAGSTGSGKSEFIVTYLLSMAVNFHPDEVQFVLIDYKGGGLAMAFDNHETGKRIPHVVGTITNLDTAEMNRTLVSINSELKKRQRMFNEAKTVTGESTIDIYKYQRYYREGILEKPISHLFIVSDEFAELKSQQPEFMNELISTARIGRSLGVHLILATQKPSGVVNDQIWSNTKFRVCLKVADRSDSMEMLKRPEAASIKETGRFYLQVGFDEYFDIGQSGWAGAKYIPSDAVIKKIDDSIKFIDNVGNITRTITEIIKPVEKVEKGDQLTNIVKHITEIASTENYVAKNLWLDKIPNEIYLGNLRQKYNYQAEAYNINPIIGEYDKPADQMQGLLTLNISNANTLIWGMNDSGKEDLLTTLIYSSIIEHTPEELNMYILDFGAETLQIFKKAPHVGEICTIEDQEKVINLFVMIDKELDRRKELFVDYGGNYKNYIEQSGHKLPLISIIINNYEIFTETMGNFAEVLSTLYRDALKLGVSFVITTGAANSFRVRLAEYFANKLCLQMANDTDYRTLLNCQKGLIPAKVKGRGISGLDDLKLEFQTAYITKPININQTIREGIQILQKKYNTHAARVPVLPEIVTVEHLSQDIKDLTKVPIGVDIDTKFSATYDFSKNKVNVILSDMMSDKTNFFLSLFHILKRIPKTKIRVLDIMKTYDNTKIPVECYIDNFDALIPALIQEMQLTDSDVKRIYVINGITKLKEKLSADNTSLYQKFFKVAQNSKDTILIIADNSKNYQKLTIEVWFNEIINQNRGIWLGTGIGEQIAIKTNNLSSDIRNQDFKDMAFIIDDENITPIKYVAKEKEEGENNEK